MKSIVLLAILISSFPAFPQCTHYPKTTFTDNSGRPVPFPSFRACSEPAVGSNCSPLVNLFTDPACTQAIPNPSTGDGNGNIDFYTNGTGAVPFRLHLQINGPGISQIDVSYISMIDNLLVAPGFPLSSVAPGATGSGTYDFSAASLLKIPSAAGYSSTIPSIGYDSTLKNIHMAGNGVDNINAMIPSSVSITNGDLTTWSNSGGTITLNDGGPGPQTKPIVANQFFTSYTPSTGIFTAAQPSFSNLSGNATAAQGGTGSTSVPSAGQLPVGNAGGTAYAPVTVSGDCTMASTGAITCPKINGGTVPASTLLLATNGSSQPVVATAHGVGNAVFCSPASGSGTTYTCTTTPSFTPVDGDLLDFDADVTNTGAITLNVNGAGAVAVKKWVTGNSSPTTLVAGDIQANQPVWVYFDAGLNIWSLMSPTAQIAAAQVPALFGDVTSIISGGNIVTTVSRINGGIWPTLTNVVGSNGAGQPIAVSTVGTGGSVVLSSGLPSYSFGCNGTATANSTLFMPGDLDSTRTCTLTSNPGSLGKLIGFPVGCTLKNLKVTCGTGGVNASSGVFTVFQATSSTAVTCTTGTGTSCTDTTHSGSIGAAGASLQIQFTTQGGETLANCAATVQCQ